MNLKRVTIKSYENKESVSGTKLLLMVELLESCKPLTR